MENPFVELFRFNLWSTRGLIARCSELDDDILDATAPGTYGSIRQTLVHLLGAEQRYVALLSGNTERLALESESFPGFDGLAEIAEKNAAALIAQANEYDSERVLRGDWGQEPYAIPAAIPLMQAIHHGNEHRAHIGTLLGIQGVEAPRLDVWAYGEGM